MNVRILKENEAKCIVSLTAFVVVNQMLSACLHGPNPARVGKIFRPIVQQLMLIVDVTWVEYELNSKALGDRQPHGDQWNEGK